MYFVPWKIALACCFFIHIHNDFSFFFQLLYLLFTCLCLPTEVQGKPYKLQAEEEKRFTEDLHESNQEVQNETSSVRGKREVIYNLTDFCSPPSYFPPKSSFRCEKGRYLCHSKVEVVCKPSNIQCLSNVPRYGFPKCSPVFDFVTIDLGSRGKIRVRRTKGCGC